MATTFKSALKRWLPPALVELVGRLRRRGGPCRPDWYTIEAGPVQGGRLYVCRETPAFDEMLRGTYDSFFWEYLRGLDLTGATVCDIGAHIGYHSLALARLVGPAGRVVAFEPNAHNVERLKLILSQNTDLASRIQLRPCAVADMDGTVEFSASANVDNATSSGGYMEGADAPLEGSVYAQAGFARLTVPACRLDTVLATGAETKVTLLKIDVEGAEAQVLAGAMGTLRRHHPLLMIEVHGLAAMLETCKILLPLGYSPQILHRDANVRCFIAAAWSGKPAVG